MPLAQRRAEVVWEGDLMNGQGRVSTGSGVLREVPVTWKARAIEPDSITSPEELIAAAHASCFSMALSGELARRGTPPQQLRVSAVCTFDRVDDKPTITSVELDVRGRVAGLDEAGFEQAARAAGEGCPVSRALKGNVDIRVHSLLEK
jgi:osmotically inducible protein OsmC